MWQQVGDKQFNHLCGVPYGALPLASGMAVLYQKPMIMTRKETKGHGLSRRIEGVYKAGGITLIIEDVATSGSSIIETVELLLQEGLMVNDVIAFMDYETGAKDRLAKKGITLHTVCTISDIINVLERRGKIDEPTAEKIRAFAQQIRADIKQAMQ